jgi:hypothetical protein
MPAAAQATTVSAGRGAVTASFKYHGRAGSFSGLRLAITRAGAVAYDKAVSSRYCDSECWPSQGSGSPLHVLDLNHDGTLEVVLDLYTGGAHCCTLEQVFVPAGATYRPVEHEFGAPGAVLEDLLHDGRREFVSADDAFAYAFTDYADSGLPLEILAFARGHFSDVTRHFPALISRDAARWLRRYRRNLTNGEGYIAAWTADEYLLGRGAAVRSKLDAERRAGHITRSFVNSLLRFLRGHGYAH